NSPMAVEEQVVVIYAGTKGHLDDVAVADVKRFESELLEYVRGRHGSLLNELKTSAIPGELDDAIVAFKEQFAASAGAAGRSADPTATDADEMAAAKSQKTLATE
ncbi:MAG: F0F1 ATP synthase subunit alpha, partial [Acidimicrobiia bacterium]|nr:F0F1 ATP synthase subunit alpha [Acidimicrobiia bacterium]